VTLSTPLQRTAAGIVVRILYSTKITDTNICPSGGTPVILGTGTRAWQETNVPPNATGPAASSLYVHVSLVLNGMAVRIELVGQDPPDTFFARYGAIWRHMLASFAPLPAQGVRTSHPCP
jgi:hypothetical protein